VGGFTNDFFGQIKENVRGAGVYYGKTVVNDPTFKLATWRAERYWSWGGAHDLRLVIRWQGRLRRCRG